MLQPLYDHGDIKGYWLSVIDDAEAEYDSLIPSEVSDVSGGLFPYLYLRLNYREDNTMNGRIEERLIESGLVRLF